MSLKNFLLLTICVILISSGSSCKKNDDDNGIMDDCPPETPTYAGTIKAIIDSNCATAGCHGDGTSPGIFTSYEGMKPWIDEGLIKKRVVDERSMPPSPAQLSSADINRIKCWLEGGAPEE